MEKDETSGAHLRDLTALLSLLSRSPAIKIVNGGEQVVLCHGQTKMTLSANQLALLANQGLIARTNETVTLSAKGRYLLPENHTGRTVQLSMVNNDLVARNLDESPLTALANRKGPNGQSFLTADELGAGERIRSDFTRSMLMPRISASWQAPVSAGKRAGQNNGAEDVTNAALEARQRIEKAQQRLGADLAGVVMDICCFLKGFEQVEMERKWPKRSAKFMLKAALAILAMHYNPPAQSNRRSHKWGTEDYRPKIR